MKVNEEVLQRIEWIDQLMKCPAWPKLRDHFTVEIEGFKNAGMIMDTENLTPGQRRAMMLTGQAAPTTDTERVRVYACFQSVVNYMERKMMELEHNQAEYQKGVQQLREEGELPGVQPQTTLTSR